MIGSPLDLSVAVVGFGYWGPHLVRNIALTEGARVAYVCDLNPDRLKEAARRFPGIKTTNRLDDIFSDPDVDLVAIATPVTTHHRLAMASLFAGKNVLVEKPLAASSTEADEILAAAEQRGLRVFVDHTFIYTPAVQKLNQLVSTNELGRLLYYDSVRINLGIFQHDVNVVWDLVTHDVAILDFLLQGRMPVAAACTGAAHLASRHADLAYLTLTYDDDFIAHINVNWLAPVKIRQVLLCGDRKMVVYDDNSASEKVKVYDNGVTIEQTEDLYEMLVQYRMGDMHAPRLEPVEALAFEIRSIVEALKTGVALPSEGAAGARVVSILEAADRSLRAGGAATPILPLDALHLPGGGTVRDTTLAAAGPVRAVAATTRD